jgi:adenylate cyclase class 2
MALVEFEAKVLGIDVADITRRIEEAGGSHVAERKMRRFVYDIRAGDQGRWMRLRDTGSEVTLCVKEIVGDSIDGTRETETSVGDFQVTHELLGLLGFRPSAYQENRRSSWLLDGARLEIDAWPLIPPYLEIEGDDAEQVRLTADRLAIDRGALTAANTTAVYAGYGIDLAAVPELRFTG